MHWHQCSLDQCKAKENLSICFLLWLLLSLGTAETLNHSPNWHLDSHEIPEASKGA